MKIEKSALSDIDLFQHFWQEAINYQQRQESGMTWREFPRELIEREILEGNHYSVKHDGEIVGYFSLVWRDRVIWDERERGDAIYVHRMCVNPTRKGAKLAQTILEWAKQFARENGKKRVRIDTWRESENLIAYYQKMGFQLVGEKRIGDEPALLPHYRNINLALFENEV